MIGKYIVGAGALIALGLVLQNATGFNTVITSLARGNVDIIKALQLR